MRGYGNDTTGLLLLQACLEAVSYEQLKTVRGVPQPCRHELEEESQVARADSAPLIWNALDKV